MVAGRRLRQGLLVMSSLALSLAMMRMTATTAAETETIPAASPLLEALAFVPPDAGLASAAFSHWEGLKAQRGGLDVSSVSDLTDRQDLLRRMAASEAPAQSLDPEVQTIWPAAWGWDATDLEWQLSLSRDDGMPAVTILRFRDGWDPGPFSSHLERHGFVRHEQPGLVSYEPGPEAWYVPGEELERLLGSHPTVWSSEPRVGLALTSDGRTVIVQLGGNGRELAEQAMHSDPALVAQSPFGRVAASLGRPLAALIFAGEHVCSGTGEENGLLRGEAARLARSVGQLRPYQALGVGYQRPAQGGGSVGRYVFDYARPSRAEHDLDGRRTLLDPGATRGGRPSVRDVVITLEDAEAVGNELLLDVRTTSDPPTVLFDLLRGGPPLFAICGPPPSDEPLIKRPTADVPLFAGPATLPLSGVDGVHAWDEIHFGAHEVKVEATVTAGRDPCSARLMIGDDATDDAIDAADGGAESGVDQVDHVPSQGFAAAPRSTARHDAALVVDYATASLRVASSCPAWSLRLEPVDDPDLPYTLAERFYPVRGASMEELVPQTHHVEDEWAAYARWNTIWQFERVESESACDVTSGSSRLAADVIYPRWRQPASVDSAVVTTWEGFIDSLTTHELGHITIALQGADAVDELLDGGFSAPTCAEVERLADRAAARLYARYDRLNDRYDEETDHGSTQGTGLAPNAR